MFLQLFFNTENVTKLHSIRFCALSAILRVGYVL